MKAMILAAGVGNRLRPLTQECPKALIEIGGIPMLEIVLRRLIRSGVRSVVVNMFHLADRIIDFLENKSYFGIEIKVSRESKLLDTGGGLKNASRFFDDGLPFFLHNVDVLTDIDLKELYRSHRRTHALATLAVRRRRASRCLLFDKKGLLCGWNSGRKLLWASEPVKMAERMAFDGVHVISPELLTNMTETGAFPILGSYLRLAGNGAAIRAFRSDKYGWWDMGSPGKLSRARRAAEKKGLLA